MCKFVFTETLNYYQIINLMQYFFKKRNYKVIRRLGA